MTHVPNLIGVNAPDARTLRLQLQAAGRAEGSECCEHNEALLIAALGEHKSFMLDMIVCNHVKQFAFHNSIDESEALEGVPIVYRLP